MDIRPSSFPPALDKGAGLAVNARPMSAPYRRNKLRTAWEISRQIENWPTAWDLRLRRHHRGLRLLRFRNGLNLVCRGGTRDWDVVHELLFAGSYGRAMTFLKAQPGQPLVLDLGGNIGLFSLLAAQTHPAAQVHAYEPGPPNFRLFEINRLANAALGERIHLHREAVADRNATVNWFLDEENPGGSGLYGQPADAARSFPVSIRAFSDVVAALPGPVALAKIDIEGAEYDLLRGAPAAAWERISAIALELHDDPARTMSQAQFLERFRALGYTIEEESVCSYFLHR